MKTSDFMNTVTVESLQKDLRSKYGVSVDIAKYSKAQLESYSNKIQNKLKEFEVKNKFNESLKNDEYQKTLLIGKIVESAINQYLDNPLESVDEEDLGEDLMNVEADDVDVARDFAEDDKPEAEEPTEPEAEEPKDSGADSKMMTALKMIMTDKNKANMARMAITKIMGGEQLNRQQIDAFKDAMMAMMEPFLNPMGVQRIKALKRGMGESVIKEGAEEQAELVMAAKDMVDRFTAFLEDVAEMGAEGMLELADSIRDELGQEQADQFVATVKPALEQTQEVLTTSREALTAGVGIITGETPATDTIGAEPEGDIEEPMEPDAELPAMDAEVGDEFGASEPATGGEEPEGREKRESYTPNKKSIAESTRIMNKLAQ